VENSKQSIYVNLTERIFSLQKDHEEAFKKVALEVFFRQYTYNAVYRAFTKALGIDVNTVDTLTKIPFLPIEFFKTQKVVTEFAEPNKPLTFTSSGTTQTGTSRHFVTDTTLYEKSFTNCFRLFFGNINNYCVLALLPSYLERTGSSLVYMAEKLISDSKHPQSDFYLHNQDDLIDTINSLKKQGQKTILLGVSYALLDLAEKNVTLPDNFIVMETGGMKGTRKEMLKEELHAVLKEKFKINTVFSEYGMTELLSQGYSLQNGLFQNPPWMRVLTRDATDPLSFTSLHKTGGINVIDLANINSCAFIATQDLGKVYPGNTFELMGRFDNSDIRGCNLLIN
jgi:phenylacetate-coenzyme A ligase PaaK-like adenylate-forming protein